jgi:hypothetical protein
MTDDLVPSSNSAFVSLDRIARRVGRPARQVRLEDVRPHLRDSWEGLARSLVPSRHRRDSSVARRSVSRTARVAVGCAGVRAYEGLVLTKFGRANPNSVAVRPFPGRFSPKHAPGGPGFGHMNR